MCALVTLRNGNLSFQLDALWHLFTLERNCRDTGHKTFSNMATTNEYQPYYRNRDENSVRVETIVFSYLALSSARYF